VTDASGRFSIERLPAGLFTVSVSRNQFLSLNYGQKRPDGQGAPVPLADSQQVKLTLAMLRGGVITGLVVGDDGQPAPNAQVAAWRYIMNSGVRRLAQTNGVTADDRGVYRLFNLQPGDYVVGATPNNADLFNRAPVIDALESLIVSAPVQPPSAPGLPASVTVSMPPAGRGPIEMPPGYLPTYYGGTMTRTDAMPLHVNAGEERSGIDIATMLVQATNVHGHVAMPAIDNVAVQLSLLSDDPTVQGFSGTRVGPDGTFTLRDVAPGTYTVLAQTVIAPMQMPMRVGGPGGPPAPMPVLTDEQKLWGRAVVTVSGDPSVTVELAMQPGKSISGVVRFEMERPPDLTRQRLNVTLANPPGVNQPMFGPLPSATIGPDGRFTIAGVTPGRYVLRGGGNLKSSIVLGRDSLDFPFEVVGDRDITDAVLTVTDKVTDLSGSVMDSSGKPVYDATVVAAAADPQYWTPASRRIVTSRPGPQGRYEFRNLPPGDYYLAVVMDLEPGGQFDPEFLKTLTTGVRVTLSEGGKLSQDLRLAR
jgi:protocatechuate 3,4-dioxygenase beta subunit